MTRPVHGRAVVTPRAHGNLVAQHRVFFEGHDQDPNHARHVRLRVERELFEVAMLHPVQIEREPVAPGPRPQPDLGLAPDALLPSDSVQPTGRLWLRPYLPPGPEARMRRGRRPSLTRARRRSAGRGLPHALLRPLALAHRDVAEPAAYLARLLLPCHPLRYLLRRGYLPKDLFVFH